MSLQAESIGFWSLPEPDKIEETNTWLSIPRISRTIPFGYEVDSEDEDILIPVIDELEALEKAKVHLRQYSYREVANWLSSQTDRYISHVGLRKRIKDEQVRKASASIKRQWAERYKKAIEAAEKIEKRRTGARE
tara:strand:+ start:3002 stop:3406 length:405 start_codon:yes stop_codon:yes gene_type:complete